MNSCIIFCSSQALLCAHVKKHRTDSNTKFLVAQCRRQGQAARNSAAPCLRPNLCSLVMGLLRGLGLLSGSVFHARALSRWRELAEVVAGHLEAPTK